MSDQFSRIQTRARTLAQSGKFAGWRAVAFELRFEAAYKEAEEWLFTLATKNEIDLLCRTAR
jgi:hypothetical protein